MSAVMKVVEADRAREKTMNLVAAAARAWVRVRVRVRVRVKVRLRLRLRLSSRRGTCRAAGGVVGRVAGELLEALELSVRVDVTGARVPGEGEGEGRRGSGVEGVEDWVRVDVERTRVQEQQQAAIAVRVWVWVRLSVYRSSSRLPSRGKPVSLSARDELYLVGLRVRVRVRAKSRWVRVGLKGRVSHTAGCCR